MLVFVANPNESFKTSSGQVSETKKSNAQLGHPFLPSGAIVQLVGVGPNFDRLRVLSLLVSKELRSIGAVKQRDDIVRCIECVPC